LKNVRQRSDGPFSTCTQVVLLLPK
jgi:hypothetical protein